MRTTWPFNLIILLLAVPGVAQVLPMLFVAPGSVPTQDRPIARPAAVERPVAGASPIVRDDRRSGPEFDLEKPLREYLGASDVPAPADGRLTREIAGRLASHDPFVLIAAVPDPIDSVHGYRFDFIYGAIQTAIERAGFSPDRFVLPWKVQAADSHSPDGDDARGRAEGARDGPGQARATTATYLRLPWLTLQLDGQVAGGRPDAAAHLQQRWPGLVVFRQRPPLTPPLADAPEPRSPEKHARLGIATRR